MRVSIKTDVDIDIDEAYDQLSYRDQQTFVDNHLDDATIPAVLDFVTGKCTLDDVLNAFPQKDVDRYFEENYGEK